MYLSVKRFLDILVALIALIILSPLLIPISIVLKLSGEGEIFYFQERIGYKNSIFNIWKFATMLKNSPNMGTADITVRNDPRILPIGNFLRKTKINELPQIINVLIGNMSFVGPRPLMSQGFFAYSEEYQSKVYQVKPGITGIGSIFFRDEELFVTNAKNQGLDPRQFYKDAILPYKGALEIWYQNNISFTTDFKILFLTAWAIIFPKSNLQYKWLEGLPERPQNLSL
jgi:lipopolysaccharide/colanic/teichoic acid biosynthesis glycosyltransferase